MTTIISNYIIDEAIHESRNSIVYQAHHKTSNQLVILKMLKDAYPPPEKIAWFNREFERMANLNLDVVVNVHGIEVDQNRWIMIQEDFGGASLEKLNQSNKVIFGQLPIPDFLHLAISITDAIGQVHQKNIIHKDINPSNIVCNLENKQVKLIDFGISTILDRENPSLKSPNVLEGTLAYISPEQTGRMNRMIDYRTDFYSLGCTFYELLTGQLPFLDNDSLSLVHAHIAKQVIPPHKLNSNIQKPLSDIIIKLMSKNAEERYQSTYGLKADLETCLEQWTNQQRLSSFLLGDQDISNRFSIPQKLYGRENELQTLLGAFEQVSQGSRELMLVTGFSGIGKSVLVQEIYKPITEKRGYFISGKFDQVQRDIPYTAFSEAFKSWTRQILTESETQIETWREKLLSALGPNGQVIIEVIPEIELIIGPQVALPELSPMEAQQRFNLTFQNFVKVLAQPEHPLVLFIDDLQWIDSASLTLMKLLLTTSTLQHLFLVGAYRNNEINETHPLYTTLKQLRETNLIIKEIELKPLTLSHIVLLISETLNNEDEKNIYPLAKLILDKTGGNPFFVNEFLKSLYREELLTFEYKINRWYWNLADIEMKSLTDNVIELMVGKIERLGENTQQVLKLASCIGDQFDLQTVAIISQKASQEVADDLWSALTEGLILPVDETYKLVELETKNLTVTIPYKFAHDRIQQAAYSMISKTEKETVHLKIGQLLLENIPKDQLEQQVFDVVNHFNLGYKLLTEQIERNEIAHLNLIAGRKAKASAAYQVAFEYLSIGLELLNSEDSWQEQYELTLNLHVEAIEMAFLSGQLEKMDKLAEIILQKAKTTLEKVPVYVTKIRSYTGQGQYAEAINTAREALQVWGVIIPEEPTMDDVQAILAELKLSWQDEEIASFINLPAMTDENYLAVLDIIHDITHALYISNPLLYQIMIFEIVKLSFKYGNTGVSASGYTSYGIILCALIGDIENGFEFAKLGMDLAIKLSAWEHVAYSTGLFYVAISHWKQPLRESLPGLIDAIQRGRETGHIVSTYTAAHYCGTAYNLGNEPLDIIEETMIRYGEILSSGWQPNAYDWQRIWHQAVLNLLGQAEQPEILNGTIINFKEIAVKMEETQDGTGLALLYNNQSQLSYHFGNYQQAYDYAKQAEPYQVNVIGMSHSVLLNLYGSLSRLAIYSDLSDEDQATILKEVTANQEQMKTWADHAPINYLHKWHLVEAERYKILEQYSDAQSHYEKAIDLAQEHRYLNEEALAYELAAQAYMKQNKTRLARYYMQDAHYTYHRWGAIAKVQNLEKLYPQWLIQDNDSSLATTTTTKTSTRRMVTTTNQQKTNDLDFDSILKGTQVLSGEIKLDVLLTKMMHIVIENAGAEQGYLILNDEDDWFIEAEGQANGKAVQVLQSQPVMAVNPTPVPQSIINYVIRTQTQVVLDDAREEGQYSQDSYIQTNQPKSVLCMPLLNQGKLGGLVYLENNLTTGAFTPNRIEVLTMLASQAAISLENARLYNTLEQRVKQRTQELSDTLDDLRATQNQLIESEKMASLGGLVAGIAHEINTPVGNSITVASTLFENTERVIEIYEQGKLKGSALKLYFDNATKISQLLLDNLDRAGELVQSFKQVAVDQSFLEQRAFKVKPYIESTLISLKPKLQHTEHTITVSGDDAIEIDSYPGALSQIITNLVMNSVTHAYPGNKAGQLQFTLTREEDQLIFVYQDDGCGIPPENLSRLFEPFFTTKRNQGGTGLGAHIVYNLVTQKLGGTIRCESELNQGTIFTIHIPLHIDS